MQFGPLQEDAGTYTEFGKRPIKHSCRSRWNFHVRQGDEGTSFWNDQGPWRWKKYLHTPEKLCSGRAGILTKLMYFHLDLLKVVGSWEELEDKLPIIKENYLPWSIVAWNCGLGCHLEYGQLTLDRDNWHFFIRCKVLGRWFHGQNPSTLQISHLSGGVSKCMGHY